MATPVLAVVAVVTWVLESAKVPLAPLAGAVKVTTVPETRTGLPLASSTVTPKGVVKVPD